MTKENNFFKDPFLITARAGELEAKFVLKHVEKLRNTSAAMQKLALQDIKDTENYTATKKDDYSHSVEDILKVLDNFIRELNAKTNVERRDFNILNPTELTLYLLWQIRNVLTHNGAGFIDLKCKTNYEQAFSEAKSHGCKSSFTLPECLEEGQQINIPFMQKDYLHIRECLLSYVKSRISLEEYEVLELLSSYGRPKFEISNVILGFNNYDLEVNLQDMYEAGIKIDYNTGLVSYPCDAEYNYNTKQIVLANGKSFPAQMIKKNLNGFGGHKIGRNDKCPCGSGKKYKKCCGDPLKKQ